MMIKAVAAPYDCGGEAVFSELKVVSCCRSSASQHVENHPLLETGHASRAERALMRMLPSGDGWMYMSALLYSSPRAFLSCWGSSALCGVAAGILCFMSLYTEATTATP